ncbi:hypothetical protein [Rhodococcus sp. 14-2470-1a]|uniref:hypothetical protein n=1 Tax=Rhodococcus sp. 14-2470-1a TaxID=2023150 RepID=UPI000B9C3570|nr:hypothetical protein [Rhodococcus sp. 14-2470-1a]OZF41914.1 hypothetical protein CH292_27295 [Rhodococcus sp. 14-2470-1a]
MKIRYTVHRKSSKIGTVEDVSDDWAARLIGSGHAVAADSGRVARSGSAGGRSASPVETDAGNAGENKAG